MPINNTGKLLEHIDELGVVTGEARPLCAEATAVVMHGTSGGTKKGASVCIKLTEAR